MRFRSPRAVLLGVVWLVACGDPPPDPGPSAPRPPGGAEAHAPPRSEHRTPEAHRSEISPAAERPVRRAASVRPRMRAPAPAAVTIAPSRPPRLDRALLAMEPAEVMRTLREIQGPLQGAHYVLQRESRVEVEGERPQSVDGELSLVDCRLLDPDDPSRGRELWIGGLRLEGAPELFEGRIETRRVIDVYGRGIHYSGRWRDARVRRGTLSGFARTLDAEIEEEWPDATRVWRRELVLDSSAPSPVVFHSEGDACPLEITLNLAVEDRVEHWEPRVREDGSVQPYRTAFDTGDAIARARLVARWVSPEPEIIDLAQRAPRVRPRSAIPTGELPRDAVDPMRPRGARPQLRTQRPERAVIHRTIDLEPVRAP